MSKLASSSSLLKGLSLGLSEDSTAGGVERAFCVPSVDGSAVVLGASTVVPVSLFSLPLVDALEASSVVLAALLSPQLESAAVDCGSGPRSGPNSSRNLSRRV